MKKQTKEKGLSPTQDIEVNADNCVVSDVGTVPSEQVIASSKTNVAEDKPQKKHYINHLRILAAIFVVAIHISSPFLKTAPAWSITWIFLSIFETVIRVAVPIFVMISGALFLDETKKLPLKKLLLHNVLRLVVIFFAWAYVYGVADIFSNDGFYWGAFIDVFKNITSADGLKYHLWFLPMLIGLYLLIPLLRCMCKKENKKVVEYFLVVFFIAVAGVNYFSSLNLGIVVNTALDVVKLLDPSIFVNYIGYFVFGWYLATFDFSKKVKKLIYIIGYSVWVGGIGVNFLYSWLTNTGSLINLNAFSLFCMTASATLFFTFKNSKFCNKPCKIIDFISNTTFGIYLTHPFIRNIVFSLFGWGYRMTCYSGWGIVLIPVYVIVVSIFSCAVTLIFNLIPKKVRRWMI